MECRLGVRLGIDRVILKVSIVMQHLERDISHTGIIALQGLSVFVRPASVRSLPKTRRFAEWHMRRLHSTRPVQYLEWSKKGSKTFEL